MLERGSAQSKNPPPVPPVSLVGQDAWAKACKKHLQSKVDVPLEVTLERVEALFTSTFESQSYSNREQRSKMILLFIRAIGEKTYQEVAGARAENPLASAFLDRLDTELRGIIPSLTLEDKVNLFRSGYPVGTGAQSLTELCIASEYSVRGYRGVVWLFAQCHHEGDPERAWSKDIFRAASVVIGKAPSVTIPEYVKGLKRMFSANSSWAPRAQELFAEVSDTISLIPLIEAYNRTRSSSHCVTELKTALLSTIVVLIDRSTGGHLKEELSALKASADLPQVRLKVVPLVQSIERITAEGAVAPTKLLSELKQLLSPCRLREAAPDRAPKEANGPQEQREVPVGTVKSDDLLATLTGETLRSYLLRIVDAGVRDPSGDIARDFVGALERSPIDKLLVIRAALGSIESVPAVCTEMIGRRIQHELSSAVPTLRAVALTDLYKVCLDVGAPQEEIAIVMKALRARLRLPEQTQAEEIQQPSAAGLIVWRWMFSELPADSALLADLTRVHFHKIMKNLAESVSAETTRELVIEATLRYGAEQGLLEGYKPDGAILELPVWQLIVFTAVVRERLGRKSSVVVALTDAICTRLLTDDVRRRDLFPQVWSESENVTTVEALCVDIRSIIGKLSLSFEERVLLLANSKLLERRGPKQFNFFYDSLRRSFTQELPEIDSITLKGDGPQTLRRSVQALAVAGYRSLSLLEDLSNESVRCAHLLLPEDLATLAEAFATLRAGTSEFWLTVASRLERDWGSFTKDSLVSVVRSLTIGAPERIPERLDSFAWLNVDGIRSVETIVQALIAVGKFTPQAGDREYHRLCQPQFVSKVHEHEVQFEAQLSSMLGVPRERIYRRVVVAGFETDWIVDYGHCRLIVELDGAAHFLIGPDGGMLQGRDAFQDMTFKRLGYEVAHVRHQGGRISRDALEGLKKLSASLQQSALDPKTPHRRYLEPLIATKDEGR